MAHARATLSPTPGAARGSEYGLIADAIYEHCRQTHGADDIILQEHLLEPDIIPNKDVQILLLVSQQLVNQFLFKVHELKGGGIGWKLNTRERAEHYKDLSVDETLVYSAIDSSGTKGIWTKTIKDRLNIHAKVTERAFKTLESKGLIEPMKDVKFPNRKMYIRKGLKPSDEATGGAWFTDGVLDSEMIELVAAVIEKLVGDKSWIEVKPTTDNPVQKRKAPQDGFDVKGKSKEKMPKVVAGNLRRLSSEMDDVQVDHPSKPKPAGPVHSVKTYMPYSPDHLGYPTVTQITNEINRRGVLQKGLLPENAVSQLLEVMVYDDKLVRVTPSNDMDAPSKTMYKTVKNPAQIAASAKLMRRLQSDDEAIRRAAIRERELEDIGKGGLTEVPCMRCPVFEFCEDGGPVNAASCTYFDDWFRKLDELHLKDAESV